jgi:DNA-binding transcriptional ArsR family regulator
MYDTDEHTVEEIAATFGVRRSTLYRHLSAHKDGRDCVFVVYRNTRPGKVDPDNRRYGETGQKEEVQREADSKWWPIAELRRPRVKAIVYIVNGVVARIRPIDPNGKWKQDDRGYVDAPVEEPLTDEAEIARRFPTLPFRLGDERPRVRGKIREYLPL